MDPLYALMMYGAAAILILFIALITAATIAGTVLALVSLTNTIRAALRARARTVAEQSRPAIADVTA